jgi:hypothetical protein
MTIQELRFFSIYLSRINARDVGTRKVRFSVEEFEKIMDFGRLNIKQLESTTDGLLTKIVHIPNENRGGWTAFQLFKRCKVTHNDNGEWYVEIDAHDEALPLMFDFKREYFTYELWNALRLRSANQIIFYEILKQFEKIGERIITIERLRERLGFNSKEYPRYHDFKRYVLDVCQEALEKYTDLKFTYEPYGKRGPGGKILALKFTITKNADFVDQLTLFEFIDAPANSVIEIDAEATSESDCELGRVNTRYIENIELLSSMCDNTFTFSEVEILHLLIVQLYPNDKSTERADYMRRKYIELKHRETRKDLLSIKSRFDWLKAVIAAEVKANEIS